MQTKERFAHRILATQPLFKGLSPEQLEAAYEVLERKTLPVGKVVMFEDDPGECIFFIAQGVTRLTVQANGKEVIIAIRGAGDVLGEISVLDGSARLATAVTQTPAVVYRASRDNFYNVLMEMRPFSDNMIQMLAKRVRSSVGQLHAMASLTVQGRLARQICELGDEHGTPLYGEDGTSAVEIPFRMTQVDLSHMIGATRVQVNQVLGQWKQNHLVALHCNHLVILDSVALRALFE